MNSMSWQIVSANPAGNITIFVLDPVESGEERADLANVLLADPSLGAEQVGFVSPPPGGPDSLTKGSHPSGPWRLEMMGGEFCGNAARSFGLYAAREAGLSGLVTVTVEISGSREALPVRVNTESGWAEVSIPGPLAVEALEFEGRRLPVYVFEGITHLIFPDFDSDSVPDRDLVFALRDAWWTAAGAGAETRHPADAFGVMFWDAGKSFMRPAVYVEATGSLVFESSCGSGTAALAAWLARDLRDGEVRCEAVQPGGTIEARAAKRNGIIRNISIGSTVSLTGPMSAL
jgi:diaminopimelate epimerase